MGLMPLPTPAAVMISSDSRIKMAATAPADSACLAQIKPKSVGSRVSESRKSKSKRDASSEDEMNALEDGMQHLKPSANITETAVQSWITEAVLGSESRQEKRMEDKLAPLRLDIDGVKASVAENGLGVKAILQKLAAAPVLMQ